MALSALKCWKTITTISFLNVFCYSKRKPLPRHPHPAYPSPWQPLCSFWFLWICLVCILHINGIVSYVRLCAWLLSLGIIFFPAVPHSVWDFSDWAQHREPSPLGCQGSPSLGIMFSKSVHALTWTNSSILNDQIIFHWKYFFKSSETF